MKRLLIATFLLLASSAWAVEEIRTLGMASATGGYSGDILVGNTCTTSTQGKFYCGVNARHIYFFTDNTLSVDLLYDLAAADTGFPYVLGGAWSIDNLATYRGRLGTGTQDNTTFLRGDGTWSVPPGSDSGGTVAWDNITDLPATNPWSELTALPWDNITRTLSSGVTDTELSYVDNVTSPVQMQLDAKQDYDADLAVLANPTAYRQFVSNGSGVITEVAYGDNNTCWISNGPSATPTWGTCGTGSGDYDPADVAITGGQIDNTPIGSTTPSTGAFTTLTRGSVSDDEFGYLNGVTSAIQPQIELKAPLVSPSLTTPTLGVATATSINTGQGANVLYPMNQGVRTTDNVVFASITTDEWITSCIASDNACGIGLGNQQDPAGQYLDAAYLWFNTTSDMVKVRNGDNTATLEVMTSGAAHTEAFGTTGLLSGGLRSITKSGNYTVGTDNALEAYGAMIYVTSPATITAPPVADGMHFCVHTIGAIAVSVDVNASDGIRLNGGTRDTDGDSITNDSAAGSQICLNADSADGWTTHGRSGTWTAN